VLLQMHSSLDEHLYEINYTYAFTSAAQPIEISSIVDDREIVKIFAPGNVAYLQNELSPSLNFRLVLVDIKNVVNWICRCVPSDEIINSLLKNSLYKDDRCRTILRCAGT
jgi:hypothetical protein